MGATCVPDTANCDRLPVWEPPIFNYSDLIDEEYEKKHQAVVEYTKGDFAKTTEFMDGETEQELLVSFYEWIRSSRDDAADVENEMFFDGLFHELA